MLRLALIENLRRVAVRVAAALDERDLAETWADAHAAGRRGAPERPDPGHRRHGALRPDAQQRLRRRIRAPPAGPGRGAGAAAHVDGAAAGRRQRDDRAPGARSRARSRRPARCRCPTASAACACSGATHWPEFVETLSSVEQILREDPIGVYGRMDFGTRDTYRHAVEKHRARLARRRARRRPQGHRARATAAAAAGAAPHAGDGDDREAHVGYYLIGNGRPALEAAMNARRTRLPATARGHSPLPAYVGGIAGVRDADVARPGAAGARTSWTCSCGRPRASCWCCC